MQRIVARLLVLAISGVVGLGMAELAVRLAAPQVTMFPRYVSSPEYEIEMARDARIRHAQGGRWAFTYTTNPLGRRGRYFSPDDTGDRRMVVVLGDSFTFGVGVEDDEVYAARLQERLGDGWGVVNGGMSGWGIDSQIKWYYRVGAEYAPEAVVLQFTANDPWDSDTGVTEIVGDGFAFHPYAGEKPGWQEWVSGSGLLQRSHLFSLVRSVQAAGGGAEAGTADPEAARAAQRVLEEVQDRYADYLRVFSRRLAADGIPLLFMSVTIVDDGVFRYHLERYPRIAASVDSLDAEGALTFVDLPLELMAGMPGSPEGHEWGPERHDAAAAALASVLLNRTVATDGRTQSPPGG